ncbi:hypothetical protein [Acidovorax kalamii]|uniref:hypothetical protein n=1 Tax=Acidovorax kalamii TaxID=2004485 RepID=UPI0020905AAF|nr:hypothetical protein [Acidovorax kalamii]MCO5355085.1 hypothetical protein [Acidovorax kalamii]
MAKHRMCPCALGKPWTFFPPTHVCQKHSLAEPQAVQSRVLWLEKGEPKAKSA